jgi:hypothetical protein
LSWFKQIWLRLLLVVTPLLMAVAPAMAQNHVVAGQATDLSVEVIPGDTYVWELYKDITGINFATDPGNCPAGDAYFTGLSTGPTVNVMWVNPGIYYYKVTAQRGSCGMNLKVGQMIVHPKPTAVFEPPNPICEGQTANLRVLLTGTPPWSITYTDGTTPVTITGIMASPYDFTVSPTVTTNYWITSVTDLYGTNNDPSPVVTLTVTQTPVASPIWHK